MNQWSDLEQLRLHKNQFNSTIPSRIWSLPELVHLHLSENQFTGFILPINDDNEEDSKNYTTLMSSSSFASSPTSETSTTGNNNTNDDDDQTDLFSGDDSLWSSSSSSTTTSSTPMFGSKLETLVLSNNLFSGTLPYALPDSIQTVWFEHNGLTGSIPWYDLGYYENLTSIRLHDNHLSGGILKCDTILNNQVRNNSITSLFELSTAAYTEGKNKVIIPKDETGMG
eukprot:CAMPEP_0194163222 /NCGR_PEP_ID=MMETSP0152-20130528/79928_1 /TAXON_ID=1049557 /ORGANISM="Thalassiothrix antarctica, Strain L6-D1" /LENGTH=225 /DNA_ID=CAMNT_0038873199 /DNA_START=422 /DNA_END=1096 /DNA_ORIENTATION=-